MLQPDYSKSFKRDKKALKQSSYDMKELADVIQLIMTGEPLPEGYKEHQLHEEWAGYTECHIEDDWLLIYKINRQKKIVVFHRTGTHEKLFVSA
ncbi:MAG: type II toxin-antitoxin system YafQ family toxin [Spirochaetaceae bacterium]|jgi:mRNA interferase YafQ|nr:type II toxin-antitoxin system YafQ family toxin [Spirochaetaceae bacterium]